MRSNLGHLSDEELELYSLGVLPESELPSFEEHLLLCPLCQDRLAETDQYVAAMREAAAEYRRHHPLRTGAFLTPWSGLLRPKFLLATAVSLLAALGLWAFWHSHSRPALTGPPVAVLLQVTRGELGVNAPSGRPLNLLADATGLDSYGPGQLIIVDARGRPVAKLSTTRTPPYLEARLQHGLRRGVYYVRLYSGQPHGELLREFLLRVE